MESLLQDIRYALVTLRRSKGFMIAGLLTLAVGIGGTTAMFSIVYGVLLRPLPYPEPQRLVRLFEEHPGAASPLRGRMLSNITYDAWSKGPRTVDAFAAYSSRQYIAGFADESARLDGAAVTTGLFGVLGVTPARGRTFAEGEDAPNAADFAILSDRLWRERFGSDPAIVGRSMAIDGRPHTIVGVMPRDFYFPDRDALLWTPYKVPAVTPVGPNRSGGMSVFFGLGRLASGATPEQASAEGTAAARGVAAWPMAADMLFGVGGPATVHARRLVDEMTADVRGAILVLAVAIGFVLLIACANVANLFLSRGVARQRELAVRAAIGAGRARLARQLLTEASVMAAGGGVLGVALAWLLVRAAPAIASANFPRLDDVRLDARVIAFAIAASAVTAIFSGLAPAVRGARFDLSESLHGGDGAVAGGFRGARARRLRDGLLVAEAAFAVMLLVGAALLGRSFVRLTHVDGGFNPANVLTARIVVPGLGAKPERGVQLLDDVLIRVRALPGVVAAGGGNMMPFAGSTYISGFQLPERETGGKPGMVRATEYRVTPGYGEALGLRVREGRLLAPEDEHAASASVLVNEEFARLYLSNGPIVGRRFANGFGSKKVPSEIVGLVANVLKDGLDRRPQPEIYLIADADSSITREIDVVIRTSGADPLSLAPQVRSIVRDLDRTAAVSNVATLGRLVSASVDQPRFAASVLGGFAGVALLLASIGLYGVLSYGVSQRRRELGVRAALGAERSHLVALILREGLGTTMVGLATGLAAAAGLTRFLQGVLFGVTPLDAASFAAAPVVLVPVALVACLIPALRAARVDPARALKSE